MSAGAAGEAYNVPIAISPASNAGGPFNTQTIVQFGNGYLSVPSTQTSIPTTTATATAANGPASSAAAANAAGVPGSSSGSSSRTWIILGLALAAGAGVWWVNR